MASRRASQSEDGSSGGQSPSLKTRGKSIATDVVKDRGRVMLKEILKEAMVEAIEEADRYERKEAGQESSGDETTGQTESEASDSGKSSSKRSWIVPVGIGLAAVYLWRRQMSGEEGVQKSITEWKSDESEGGESDESALSEDEDAGYGTAGDEGMQAPEGVDTDESGRASGGEDDDEAAETTETP